MKEYFLSWSKLCVVCIEVGVAAYIKVSLKLEYMDRQCTAYCAHTTSRARGPRSRCYLYGECANPKGATILTALAGGRLRPTIVRTLNWTLVAAQALPRDHCFREAGAQKAWTRPFGHGWATWQAPEDERWTTHSLGALHRGHRSRGPPPCSPG